MSELQQWAESAGRFAKSGEKLELQVKGRQKEEVVQVTNGTKSKLWYCGFCGDSCIPRSIAKHLVKPQQLGKRGSCGEVTVEALREVMCFCAAEDAELAEQKIQEISGGGTAEPKAGPKETKEPKEPKEPKELKEPKEPKESKDPKEPKAKGKRSSEAPKESPKRAKAKAAPKSPEKRRAKDEKPQTADEPETKAEDRSDVKGAEKKGKKEKNENEEKEKLQSKEPQEENPRDSKKSKDAKDPESPKGKKRKETVAATSTASKKGKTGKEAPKPKVDLEAEAVHKHDGSDHEDDMEEAVDEVCLGIDGLDDWELPNIPEVGLVASASAVAETLFLTLELKSNELTGVVQLQGGQSEFLTKKFGPSTWSSLIAAAADATLDVQWDSVTITADSPRGRMIAATLLGRAMEFHSDGGIIVGKGPMHPLITVVKLGALPHSYLEWFAELGEKHQVCIIPARLAGSLELVKGASVQVQERDRWISAEVTKEPCMGLLWVSIDGSQREVEVSSLRCGFDLVAIFGEQQQRAMVQLALMSDCWSRATGCSFGEDSTLALGPRQDWGTYRKYFHDTSFIQTYSHYMERVLQPASGCAARFIGQMFFATGFRESRCCAALMLRDLEKAHKNYGELPAGQEAKRFSLRISPNRPSIMGLLGRKPGYPLQEEERFQSMVFLSREKGKKQDVSQLPEGTVVEVLSRGCWCEAMKAATEADTDGIKVTWPLGGSALFQSSQVRSLGSEVLCSSVSAFQRVCTALHFLARSSETSKDGGFQALRDVHKLPRTTGQVQIIEAPRGTNAAQTEWRQHVAACCQRIATASNCAAEVIGGSLVLFGDDAARESAQLVLSWIVEQAGNALASLVPKLDLAEVELTEEEVKMLTVNIIHEVEKKAKAYIFLRDDNSQYLYKHGDSIEFLGEEGKWCRGTFVRKCVGATHQAKIRYQHQQRDLEHVASLKDVRPDESQRKAPAVCVYSRFARSSGRGGVTVVARCLKAALRDALGKASTGQGWRKGGGKAQSPKPWKNDWPNRDDKENWKKKEEWKKEEDWKKQDDWKKDNWKKQEDWKKDHWKKEEDWKKQDDWKKDDWKQEEDWKKQEGWKKQEAWKKDDWKKDDWKKQEDWKKDDWKKQEDWKKQDDLKKQEDWKKEDWKKQEDWKKEDWKKEEDWTKQEEWKRTTKEDWNQDRGWYKRESWNQPSGWQKTWKAETNWQKEAGQQGDQQNWQNDQKDWRPTEDRQGHDTDVGQPVQPEASQESASKNSWQGNGEETKPQDQKDQKAAEETAPEAPAEKK